MVRTGHRRACHIAPRHRDGPPDGSSGTLAEGSDVDPRQRRDGRWGFGKWDTIYKNFNRWSERGFGGRVKVQSLAGQTGKQVALIDSTSVRVHQHGATLLRGTRGRSDLREVR